MPPITRRHLLLTLPAAAFAPRTLFAATPPPTHLYIGTGSIGPGKGILTGPWNPATGAIGDLTLAAEVPAPSFLAQHRLPTGETLIYSVSETNLPTAKVSAFTTVPNQPTLRLLNQVDPGGNGPTHLSVTPDGRTILVANYGGGSVSSFHVLPSGELSPAVSHFQFTGSGPYKGRQDTPHTHSAVPSPDGRFALVNDLGLDRIMIYALDPATSTLTPANPPFWSARPGTGPRHLAWHPSGRFVFCTNELDSTVETLTWSEDPPNLRSVSFASTLPPNFPPQTAFVGEVAASPDGRNVYAGNRVADDTIAVFDVNQKTGTLTQTRLAPGGGKNARHIALDPSGRWLVICHQNSNDLVVLERNKKTGQLSPPIHTYPAQNPMCTLFA